MRSLRTPQNAAFTLLAALVLAHVGSGEKRRRICNLAWAPPCKSTCRHACHRKQGLPPARPDLYLQAAPSAVPALPTSGLKAS